MRDSATTDDGRGLQDARARVETLFLQLNALTPDELGRVGLLRPSEERESLIAAVDAAASATGRQELVAEARREARDIVLRRYADGTFRPTWIALNWGLSGGTVDDRVAVVEAVADAAAAAVVEDMLDPETAEALMADAVHVLGLAGGSASDGSLARGLRQPADPDLRRSRGQQRAVVVGVAIVVVLLSLAGLAVGAAGAAAPGVAGGLVALAVAVALVYWLLTRVSDR